MPIKTMLLYLLGNREAIDRVARDKSAIWYGLFFVMIAGVAREYDQESLFHHGYIFLYPLLLSAPLALLFYGYLKLKHKPRKTPNGLRSYFGLFWMTAPLAFLYALPVEYLFSSMTALKLNMALLAIVATWRVVLFARVIALTLKQPFWLILIEILWGGSVFAFFASAIFSFSLTEIMGGTVHSAESGLKADIANFVTMVSGGLAIGLLLGQFVPGRKRQPFPTQDHTSPRRLTLPIALVAVSLAILILRQPALYRSARAARLIEYSETVREGLDYLSRYQPDDFARTWPLPPAGRSEPMRLRRAEQMLREFNPEHAEWIGDEIVDYLDIYLSKSESSSGHHGQTIIRIVSKLPPDSKADACLVKHKHQVIKEFDEATQYGQSMIAVLHAAEKRLAKAGITVSMEEEIFDRMDHALARESEWKDNRGYLAKDVLELVTALPANDLTDEYIRDHQGALAKAHALVEGEGRLYETTITNFLQRLSQSGITLPEFETSP